MPRQDSLQDQLRTVRGLAVKAGCYDADDLLARQLDDNVSAQVYFYLPYDAEVAVRAAIWAMEDSLKIPRSRFSFTSIGSRSILWAERLSSQRLIQAMLIHMDIEFTVGAERDMALILEDRP